MSDDKDVNGAQDDAMQALIGKHLRTMYDSVLCEPIPDRIVELLARLDTIDLPRPDGKDGGSDSR